MFGGFGIAELLILLAIVLLLFGAKRLPELARGLGKSVTNFKSGLNEDQTNTEDATTTQQEKSEQNEEVSKILK